MPSVGFAHRDLARTDFAHSDFAYAMAADSVGLPLVVSVFADHVRVRDEIEEDVGLAGFTVGKRGSLDLLLEDPARSLGDLVVIDCPDLDAAGHAALAQLDTQAARTGARLIISTNLPALDAVFGCCATSQPQILVDPRRADRVIALGRTLAEIPNMRVRELSEDDRMTLLRLTEQVAQIAERLDKLGSASSPAAGDDSAFRFENPLDSSRDADRAGDQGDRLVRASRPPLPDPRLVRRIIHQRQLRGRFFDGDLFADPAWDMLLDLTAARAEHARVSVTSLCIASGVPPTTALRWISQMTDAGLFERIEDETDRRRAFIQLTDKSAEGMARYFHQLGKAAAQLV